MRAELYILLAKYNVLHPGNFGRFRVHGKYLQSRCVLYMGVVEIRSCFHIYTCRDTMLYEMTYLCSPVVCYLHASLRSFATREEVVRECMSCGKGRKCRI